MLAVMMASGDVTASLRPTSRPSVVPQRVWSTPPRPGRGGRSWSSTAGLRVCRKYRRSRRRHHDVDRLQQREYDKLRRIVPALRLRDDTANHRRPRRVSKVTTSCLLSSFSNSTAVVSSSLSTSLYGVYTVFQKTSHLWLAMTLTHVNGL